MKLQGTNILNTPVCLKHTFVKHFLSNTDLLYDLNEILRL